jgi:hypothetical protein
LTPLAEEWVTRLGNAREQAIDRALASLGEEDRAVIDGALPALKRFAKAMADKSNSAAPSGSPSVDKGFSAQ